MKISKPINLKNLRSVHTDIPETNIKNLSEKKQLNIVFRCLKQDLDFEIYLGVVEDSDFTEVYAIWKALKKLAALGLATLVSEPKPKLDDRGNEVGNSPSGFYLFRITGDGLYNRFISWYRWKKGLVSFWQIWGGYFGIIVAIIAVIVSNMSDKDKCCALFCLNPF